MARPGTPDVRILSKRPALRGKENPLAPPRRASTILDKTGSRADTGLARKEATMSETIDRVDGWEVRPRPDGGFGVYDLHGLIAGPFGTRAQAIAAALDLPRPGNRPRPASSPAPREPASAAPQT
jgi:hypothetical protein